MFPCKLYPPPKYLYNKQAVFSQIRKNDEITNFADRPILTCYPNFSSGLFALFGMANVPRKPQNRYHILEVVHLKKKKKTISDTLFF